MRKAQTIAVDFDGTIVDHVFPRVGAIKPGAKETINFLYENYNIVIYSCRSSWGIRNGFHQCEQDMIDCLNDHGIKYDRIAPWTEGKVLADYYIDDRAIEFKDNWNEIKERLT